MSFNRSSFFQRSLLVWALFFGAFSASAMMRKELVPDHSAIIIRTAHFSVIRNHLIKMYDVLAEQKQYKSFEDPFLKKIKKKMKTNTSATEFQMICSVFSILDNEVLYGFQWDSTCSTHSTNILYFYLSAEVTQKKYQEILQREEWFRNSLDLPVAVVKSDFQGVEISQFVLNQKDKKDKVYWQAFVNNTFLFAQKRDWIEQSITRLKKATLTPSFPDSKPGLFAEIYFPYISGDQKTFKKTQKILGGDLYTFSLIPTDDGLIFNGFLRMNSPKQGIFSLFRSDSKGLTKLPSFQKGLQAFCVADFDLVNFWKKLPRWMSVISIKKLIWVLSLDQSLKKSFGLSLEDDIFRATGSRFSSATYLQGTNSIFLHSLSLRDEERFIHSFATIRSIPALATAFQTPSSFRSHPMYSIGEPENADPVLFCIANNTFFNGNSSLIKAMIVRNEEPNKITDSKDPLQQEAEKLMLPNAFLYGAKGKDTIKSFFRATISDHSVSLSYGFSNEEEKDDEPLEEGEISLDYLSSFLGEIYYSAAFSPKGLHHRIVFKSKEKEQYEK